MDVWTLTDHCWQGFKLLTLRLPVLHASPYTIMYYLLPWKLWQLLLEPWNLIRSGIRMTTKSYKVGWCTWGNGLSDAVPHYEINRKNENYGLQECGFLWNCRQPEITFYIWVQLVLENEPSVLDDDLTALATVIIENTQLIIYHYVAVG